LKEQKAKVYRVAKQFSLLAIVVSLAGVFVACDRSKGGSDGQGTAVAASVNDKKIMLTEVDKILEQQAKSQQVQFSDMSQLELAAGRLQVLDELIRREVLFQRAEKEKLLPTDDEVAQAINSQKQQLGTQEEFQRALKESGQTEDAVRDIARRQLAIQKLLDRTAAKIQPPTDKEVEDFYNNNKARYVSQRGVALAAIIVDPADNGATNDAKNDIEAKNKIDIIFQRLKSNADFATVARAESEDPQSVQRGGDIGFFTEDQLKQSGFPQDLVGRFFGEMQVGSYTSPIQSSGRWTIFKLTDKRLQSENLTLDNAEVRKDATDNILNQRKQILNAAMLEVAMREAKITNNLAQDMLNSTTALSSLRPAGSRPATTETPAASPATGASPGASPANGGAATTNSTNTGNANTGNANTGNSNAANSSK
ncbi:MAG TPA: SurA N-terminal domain-containing protein, partial [Pyrinomonadaceae bacterium]|nr:SurA N-terminal domain-containing protein [Pyrinomonadaceae bacterium]